MMTPIGNDYYSNQVEGAQRYLGVRESLLDTLGSIESIQNDDALMGELPYIKAELTGKYFLFKTPDRINQRVQFSDIIISNGQKIFTLVDGTQIHEYEIGGFGEFLDGAGGASGYAAQSGAVNTDPEMVYRDNDILGYNSAPPPEPEDPIIILLKKAQIDPIDVTITLNLKIPPIQLRELIRKFYEGADEKITMFSLKSVNQEELMSQIKVAIEAYINDEEVG